MYSYELVQARELYEGNVRSTVLKSQLFMKAHYFILRGVVKVSILGSYPNDLGSNPNFATNLYARYTDKKNENFKKLTILLILIRILTHHFLSEKNQRTNFKINNITYLASYIKYLGEVLMVRCESWILEIEGSTPSTQTSVQSSS